MKPDRALSLACLAILVSVALLCTCASLAGGDVTETGNARITGRVLDTLGRPVPEARVVLLPALYNPLTGPAIPDTMVGITDDAGHYTMKAPGPGAYCVEAADGNSKYKALVTGVNVDKKDTVTVPESILRRPGALRVVLPDTVNDASGYVYLPGTTCYASVQSGIATVDAVPAGFIPSVNYANTAVPDKNHVIQTNLTAPSNDTLVIADIISWEYSKKLYLNTTAGGASVGQNVYDFPVLVRLTSANIDFSLAKSDGSDIRFTKSNGAPLPYEIERWDPVTGHAELWVRVDTVYGNDESQYIVMYWGNPAATDGSESAAVFDTAGGFQGVWHLSGPGNTTAFDATFNHYDGTPAGMSSASTAAGMIGQARAFDGFSSALSMPNTAAGKLDFPENGTYSMSLWAYADTIDTLWHAIAGKGHEQYYIQYKCFGNNKAKWEFVEYHDKRGWEVVDDSTAPGPKQWVYLVGVRSGSSQKLYVNGVLASEAKWIMPGTYARNTGDNFSLGRYERPDSIPDYQGWSYFKGSIDEVRVSSVAPTPDWIKLCYMNQKKQDVLLKW
jgi:hypothetical protein